MSLHFVYREFITNDETWIAEIFVTYISLRTTSTRKISTKTNQLFKSYKRSDFQTVSLQNELTLSFFGKSCYFFFFN